MTLIDSVYTWLDSNGPATVAEIAGALGEGRPTISRIIGTYPHRFANGVGGNSWRTRRPGHNAPARRGKDVYKQRDQSIYEDFVWGESVPGLGRKHGLTAKRISQIIAERRTTPPGWGYQPVTLESGRTVQAHYSTVNHVWMLADGVTVVWPEGVGI